MNKSDEYAAALDKLDQMRASGLVTQNEYDVRRASLLAEASQVKAPMSAMRLIWTIIGGVIVLLVLLRILGVVINAATGHLG